MTEKFRFAPLIRVSTESQEKRGESLNVQKKQIKRYVELLDGVIPDNCWIYSGQEHATPEQERAKLDQLLKDSGKGIFDSIICCDASRWSRDNLKSKEGLEILRQNGIKFFVGTTEYDLYNPEQVFFLSLAVEIGEFTSNQSTLKSILSRIERAKKGIPTSGSLPYGRTFSKETGQWGLDAEKAAIIEQAAKEYLAGVGGKTIAKKLDMDYPTLLKIFKNRCGDKWVVKFRSKKLNISESVTITIPRLLAEEVIEAVHKRTASNRTYTHGQLKHPYPLRSMIFCDKCGYVLNGECHTGHRYYRHPAHFGCKTSIYVPAETVEDSVLFNLFSFFGDKSMMEKAAQDAIPNLDEIEKMQAQIDRNKVELKKIKGLKSKLLDAIEQTGIDEDIKGRLKKHKDREILLKEETENLVVRVKEFPSKKEIGETAALIQRINESYFRGPDHLKEMSMDDKRAFFGSIFGGKTRDGKRQGIYVSKYEMPNGETNFVFKLLGNLIIPGINDTFHPLFKGEKEAIADVPEGFFDEKEGIKVNGGGHHWKHPERMCKSPGTWRRRSCFLCHPGQSGDMIF